MSKADVVIIGGGHNALVCAAYLADAGRSVVILERNDRPGGFVRTDEIMPGHLADTFSSSHPLLLLGPAYAKFAPALEARGLRYLSTDFPTGISVEGVGTAVMGRTAEAIAAEAERCAAGDGDRFLDLLAGFAPYSADMFSLFNLDLASPEARAVIRRLMTTQGGGMSGFGAFFFDSARTVLAPFRSELMRAMLGSWIAHAGQAPDDAGSGVWVLLFALTLMAGGMPIAEGGAETLARAFAKLIADQGGTIHCNTAATRIETKGGRAVAVRTASGEVFEASQAVVASVNADQLYMRLLDPDSVPGDLRRQAERFRYGGGCLQLNLALREPPAWPDSRMAATGQPFLGRGLDGLSLAVAQGRAGLLPASPSFTADCPTVRDPGRAPPGRAVLRVQVLDLPTHPRGDAAGVIDVDGAGWTPALTERFAARIVEILGRHIPNVPDAIEGRLVVTPATLAAFNPNAGPGDPYGGANDLAQGFMFRPLPSQPSHQTFVSNLYMLGAGTWPGSGVSGCSGHIVAQKLLDRPAA